MKPSRSVFAVALHHLPVREQGPLDDRRLNRVTHSRLCPAESGLFGRRWFHEARVHYALLNAVRLDTTFEKVTMWNGPGGPREV
jgi:hypothetical protein